MPWPNRLRDGRYTFDGEDYQLALSEPARGNASHGLVRWARGRCSTAATSDLTVGYRLHPQQGWSGTLDLTVDLRAVRTRGCRCADRRRTSATTRVPFGCGAHPYVALGDTRCPRSSSPSPPRSWCSSTTSASCPPAPPRWASSGRDFRSARAAGRTPSSTRPSPGWSAASDGRWEVGIGGLADAPGRDRVGRRGLRLGAGVHRPRARTRASTASRGSPSSP